VNQETLGGRALLSTQVVALAAVLLYAIGFVIISLHHARFGVLQFGLLRPKILSAGVLFCIFVGLPVLESARNYGLLGYADPYPKPPRVEGEFNKVLYYLPVIRILSFIYVSVALSWSVRIFFQESGFNLRLIYWTIAMVIPAVGAFRFERAFGQSRPVACAYISLFALLWMLFCIGQTLDLGLAILMSWFGWCGMIAFFLDPVIKGTKKLRHLQWQTWVAGAISTLAFFSLFLYPSLNASLGGGAPISATIQFREDTPLSGSGKMQSWLLDETDAGFYILSSRQASKAIFVPRISVRAIYFGENRSEIKSEQPGAMGKLLQENRSPDSKATR
jgi:hypothetical protein